MKNLHFDELYVGNSLTALAFAYYDGLPIIVHGEPPQYYFFDKLGNGKLKVAVWREFAFQLSMAGLLPFANKVQSFRMEDEHNLYVVTDDGGSYNITVDKLYNQQPAVLKDDSGIPMVEMIDWFRVNSGRVHEHDKVKIPEKYAGKFNREILFYPTRRYQGPKLYKDLLVSSYIPEGAEREEENSELYVRFQVESTLKDLGIKGRKNGIDPKGKQKRLKLKIEHENRNVRPHLRSEEPDIFLMRSASFELFGSILQYRNLDIGRLADKFGDPFG